MLVGIRRRPRRSTSMTPDEAMARLEKAGSPQTRKTYRRHGVTGVMFGVSYTTFGRLAQAIKVDHVLASKLWATGNHDARILATMIADPRTAPRKELEAWAAAVDNYPLCDAVATFVARPPHAHATAKAWTQSTSEYHGQAGWTVFTTLISSGDTVSDEECLALLARIEKTIAKAKNRVRQAMNDTVIAIGSRSEKLSTAAIAGAQRIGVVTVDHGAIFCKTPDAVACTEKAWGRKREHPTWKASTAKSQSPRVIVPFRSKAT
jgi:3-methyladenine DNA glycosylase AlkD